MWENLIFTGALQQLYLYIVYAVYNVALEGAVKQKKNNNNLGEARILETLTENLHYTLKV